MKIVQILFEYLLYTGIIQKTTTNIECDLYTDKLSQNKTDHHYYIIKNEMI